MLKFLLVVLKRLNYKPKVYLQYLPYKYILITYSKKNTPQFIKNEIVDYLPNKEINYIQLVVRSFCIV